MSYQKSFRLPLLLLLAVFHIGCSEDSPEPKKETSLPLPPEEEIQVSAKPTEPEPLVYIEELDQFQEYFKEQHETSFSHVTKKNWMSYTAGKDGILTKVLLFGKPNYTISEHYGSYMSGFVRSGNPDTGPKYGEWSISREEIINQLAIQGLTETDRGWITLQMRGEIPQEAGRMYFLVCDDIGDKKAWFGAFSFAEGNNYKKGRFWLHPEHDLVFRTYVGKTADQLEKEQRGEPLFGSDTASLVPANDLPESPKPMVELSKNFEPSELSTDSSTLDPVDPEQSNESLYQPATLSPKVEIEIQPSENKQKVENLVPPVPVEAPKDPAPVVPQTIEESETETPKRSLFERYFKEKSE